MNPLQAWLFIFQLMLTIIFGFTDLNRAIYEAASAGCKGEIAMMDREVP
jgi:hypothetical protein